MYVVVNRRTNVEVYAQGFYSDSFKNAVPGTVLDTGVTSNLANQNESPHPQHEFFLISTSQRLGIATPTKCQVIYDSIGDKPQQIHLLSYKLCHTYFNIPQALKLPAPIMYAQKLSKLIAQRSKLVQPDPISGGQVTSVNPVQVHQYFTDKAPGLYFL